MHETVLKKEAVAALVLNAQGFYVDGTFGRGGHAREILANLAPAGRLLALDRDAEAEAAAAAITDERFMFCRGPFSSLAAVVEKYDRMGRCDGILVDLGVSSPQLDTPERGFSFRSDGPLDMRMDTSSGVSAAQWLAEAEEAEIATVLKVYGEERFAKRIARNIVAARVDSPITRTAQLAAICEQSVGRREPGKNPATRTFQAIRIKINGELDELEALLDASLAMLKVGGRLVVISFHSLEDRIAKRFIRRMSKPEQLHKSIPVTAAQETMPLAAVGKAIFASPSEVALNPRARSAVMRVAQRLR